jgi:hypothetical protein
MTHGPRCELAPAAVQVHAPTRVSDSQLITSLRRPDPFPTSGSTATSYRCHDQKKSWSRHQNVLAVDCVVPFATLLVVLYVTPLLNSAWFQSKNILTY